MTQVEDLNRKIAHLECQLQQVQDHADTLHLVLSWLLAKEPGEEAASFLRGQANELEPNPKFREWVTNLDDLAEDVAKWRELWGE